MRLYISSGSHVDDVEDRIAEIIDHLGSPDVVFGEGGEASLVEQLITIVYLFPRAPLIALAAAIQIFLILYILGTIVSILTRGVKGQDTDIMQQIASKYDAEICEIDSIHTARPVYDRPILWGIANWIPIIGLTIALSLDTHLLIVTATLITIAYLLLHTMLYLVNEQREDRMAETIQSRAKDVESACVVLGEAHHAGVGKRLIQSDRIDVLNLIPDNPDLMTLFNIYIWDFIDSVRDKI